VSVSQARIGYSSGLTSSSGGRSEKSNTSMTGVVTAPFVPAFCGLDTRRDAGGGLPVLPA
jgi:hypothetical protein